MADLKSTLNEILLSVKVWQTNLHAKLVEADKTWEGDPNDLIARLVAAGMLQPPLGFTVEMFLKDRKRCSKCKNCHQDGKYSPEFDAYYCPRCHRWIEVSTCAPNCILCQRRNSSPVPED